MAWEENEVTYGRKDGKQFLPRSIMELLTPPERSKAGINQQEGTNIN